MKSVTVVIVTFNRLEMLKQCLDAVLSQSYPIYRLIIIDNASTDGTADWVKLNFLSDQDVVELVQMDSNTGGAGGFHHGFKLAHSTQADYVWAMDDDVAPEVDCLKKLIEVSNNQAAVQPTRINLDGSVFNWHQIFDPLSYIKYSTRIEANPSYIVATNVACFEGILLPRNVIDVCGLPQKDYFICEDDTIYGYTISKHFPILYTSSARLKRLGNISKRQTPWKIYYYIRNKVWNIKIIRNDFALSPALMIYSYILFPLSLFKDLLSFGFSFGIYKSFFAGLLDGFRVGNK